MGKQATEMLKGTLEGIVLGVLSGRSAYGYEITAWLREQGFTDIAEGTIYALLLRIEQRGYVDVTKEPSEKGPPRKVYALNGTGERTLDEFWSNWSFLAERIDQLRARVETPGIHAPRAAASGTASPLTATPRTEGEQS